MNKKINTKNLSSRNWKIERQTPYVGLNKEEEAWLRQFDFEFGLAWFKPGLTPLHPPHLMKSVWDSNNSTNRDIFSKAARQGKLDYTALDAESVHYPRSKRDKKDE